MGLGISPLSVLLKVGAMISRKAELTVPVPNEYLQLNQQPIAVAS